VSTTDRSPAVCAIVLTWNNFEDTDECLRSVADLTYKPLSLIVVDNASTDGSYEHLISAWGDRASFVRNPANLGVAAGYNAGIRAALETGAEYVLLLNNDVVLDPGLIEALLPAFEAVPRLGTVSPIITYYRDRDLIWFAGARFSRTLGLSRHRLLAKPLRSATRFFDRLYATDYIPTCVAMTPRHVFEEAGLLDERFFIGNDDIDWGLRLRDAGLELRVIGRPLAAHKVSATAGTRGSNVLSQTQAYHYARGSMLLAAKWAPGWRLFPFLAAQVLVKLPYYSAQMALARRLSGAGRYLRGLVDGYRSYLRDGRET